MFTDQAPTDGGLETPGSVAFTGTIAGNRELYRIGTLESVLDADNFAKIRVEIP